MKKISLWHYVQSHQWQVILLLVLMLLGPTTGADTGKAQRLALLVAAPWEGETAMHNDLVATYNALRQRGFSPEEFLVLAGSLTRSGLLTFLHDAQRRMGSWHSGEVWLSFSGHGTFRGTTAAEARPGLLLTSALHPAHEEQVLWEEIFAELQVPAAVQLTLLPDSWHTNLLAGRVPANVVALVMKAEPGAELACRARNYRFESHGSSQERGIISYYAVQTLAQATTHAVWLQHIEALSSADLQGGRLPLFYQPALQLLGHTTTTLPGDPVKTEVEQR